MTEAMQSWGRYLRWNQAIADVVFTNSQAGRPVYLDLEDDVLTAIRDQAEPEAQIPSLALVEAGLATLHLDSGRSNLFRGHFEQLQRWHNGTMLEPPPTLGLLSILSLAAERMRQSTDMGANNFYGRLAELFGFDEEDKRLFTDAYRRTASQQQPASRQLWESLNDWLEMHEGRRGSPTAHPLGHEHIGWALSQALVREADRAKFIDLFAVFGLPSNGILAASEMSSLIDEWMSRQPCPATNHLERLWKDSPLTRPRITELACLELESWDGSVPEGTRRSIHREIDSVKARAVLRSFPARRLDISIAIPTHARTELEQFDVLDLDGSLITTLDVVPVASGWIGVSAAHEIDTNSLLGGEVRLLRPGSEKPLLRRPRRLIPLRWDELLASFVECERVQLGEETMVISRIEIASVVGELLENAARPGYRRLDEIDGLPKGWVLFDGVQILSSIPQEMLKARLVDCYVLQPLALSQGVLQGGLQLPGHLKKWHQALPPELRASSDDGNPLTATMRCVRPLVNPPPADEVHATAHAALIWDLAALDLPDGDYEIEIHAGKSLINSQLLRLRSADSPSLRPDDDHGQISHHSDEPGFGLVSVRSDDGGFRLAPEGLGELIDAFTPAIPDWWTKRREKPEPNTSASVVRFPQNAQHSCIRTGAHHMMLPTVTTDSHSIEGVCRYCGLVKAYPTRYRARRTRPKATGQVAPKVQVGVMPRVRTEQSIDWDVAFDAVCHVGSGSIGSLERITSQMENADLSVDMFVRRLEVLGHIEVERSLATLTPSTWQMNDPTLLELENGQLVFVGFRCERVMVAIEDSVYQEGGELVISNTSGAPPHVTLQGLDELAVKKVLASISNAARRPSRMIRSAGRALATVLQPLSLVRAGLPRTSTISARSYERWNSVTARFEPAADAGSTGAFRLSTAGRTYIYREPADLGKMEATLGDARIVKYLAAADAGQSLIGYAEDRQILYVPLGADLPVLYGRAAVLCAGKPPFENTEEQIVEYHGVPADVAAHLNHLLMN